MAGRRTRRNTAASAQSTVRSDQPEQGMIVQVNGLETALNNVASMMANIMERLDQALPGPSSTRNVPTGQPRQTVDSKVADWVNHIPAGSIRTWDELGLRFLEHFAGNCRPKKHFTHLASVRQKHGESLKNFLARWRKESREVEGTDDKSRLAMFTAALQDGLLHTDLTTHPPDTFEEAMVRAGRYVTLEERKEEKKEKTPKEEEKAGNKKPFKNKKQGFPDGPKGTNPGTSEKHKSANPVFTLLVAEVMAHAAQQGLMTYPTYSQKVCNVEDTGKWCAYHLKNDHNTEDYYTLMNEMTRLIRRGLLKKFVQDGGGNAYNRKRREGQVAQAEAWEKRHIGLEDEEENSEPAPHRQKRHHGCNYIIGGNIGGDSATSRKKWANAAMVNKVAAHAQPEGKKLRTEPILFSNADLPETGVPHRDALVITIDIMDLLIHKTLVDTGNSVNIMYMDTYKALGLARDELLPIKTPLTGFTGDSIEPEGVITLPVETRIRRFGVCYLTSSPVHKVPNPPWIGIARGSQRVSRAWYLKATKQPIRYDTQVGEVTAQFLRTEERRPRVEVAGDIEEVKLEPADMPGLDHKIAAHRLNVLQDAKPVKQKRRHLSQERRDFVKKEKKATFEWTQECQVSFEELKKYLASPLVLSKPEPGDILTLYLAIADCAISTMIVREENGAQHPVYYVSIVLITLEGFRIYYAIRFQFRVSNNEAEYEALINGLKILGKLGLSRVQVYSDSRLVVGQISGEFEAKEERMKKYRDLPLEMLGRFEYKLEHIPRAYNAEADVLSKLGAESREYISKLATVEELATPSLNRDEVLWVLADPPEWLDRLARYIEDGVAPEDPQEARLLRMRAPTYKVQDGILYKRSYNGVLLHCLRVAEAKALMEEIHEGVCAEHQGPYSISRRAIIQGYFWPTVRKDCEEYVRKCPTCQQFQNIPGRQAMNYTPISSVIPFSRWGIDIVGALPKGIGQARWIVVA
ncbi:unnamed protein product [Cuscuta campestris]|uniref:RNase H type-1 domain-containing protein n=1 Tax=Cuscuta campestris TaxID=132261 RepID=A0A484LVZ1_9ASTE|nr:unnamed protein product [Cuscuta campestris]